MKRAVTIACGENSWQRGYHAHIIRNDADYLRVWDYIDTNPAKWREDCYYCQAQRATLPGRPPTLFHSGPPRGRAPERASPPAPFVRPTADGAPLL